MADVRCHRESEIVDALGAGRSAAAFDDDLRSHADACPECRDLLEVAEALLDDRRTLMRQRVIPGSGLVWWRATMKARRESARATMRTARLVQAALVLTSLIVAVALLGIRIAPADVKALLTATAAGVLGMTFPLLAIAAWLVLAPVALYYVVSED